jgi:pimeloyl-ACP methyl ester carboxylesterase
MSEYTDDSFGETIAPSTYDYYSTDISYDELDAEIEGSVGSARSACGEERPRPCPPDCMKRHIHVREPKCPPRQPKKRVLFVRGFGSDIPTDDSVDAYKHIRNYFVGNDRFHVEWFEYGPNDQLSDVYAGLIQRIDMEAPDVLIGHSMGGLLVYRYMADRLKCCADHSAGHTTLPIPILLMAYIQEPSIILYKVVKLLPSFIRNQIRLPFEIMFPSANVNDDGNFLNGSYRITLARQIYDAVGYQAKSETELVETLERMRAMMIVGRQDGDGGMLTDDVLKRLRDNESVCLAEIDGKHEAFSSRKNSSVFFEVFDAMLDTVR